MVGHASVLTGEAINQFLMRSLVGPDGEPPVVLVRPISE